ncbi:MAG TPA: glycosyltransferase [Bacteroidia bacterium]
MVQLSVVIVNYNVKHFVEQCLHSVFKAAERCSCEVFVVDNNSVDGSVELIQQKFPEVKLIANKENVGFSKANNQAIRISTGKYVLLLNPDTVVEEDTFQKCIAFMDEHTDAGGLGVKMLDGKGVFLPESKRGLPTPSVAFYKIFGLSALFPKSKTFGKYHLGYLDKDQVHEVDVLSGAFMLMRNETLDKVGLLDEDFFMYGEDIDLSYRITKGGYKNYYFPETRIIHYKGESTKKSSVNYVFVFYKAMVIFARKHFSQRNAKTFSFLINLAIYLRAFMAVSFRFMKAILLPVVDFSLMLAGLLVIKYFYEKNVIFKEGGNYSETIVNIAFPAYILIWQLLVYLSGGYDKPVRLYRILRGLVVGTGLILIIYSLLPESYRFSRALILLGSAWALVSYVLLRITLHFMSPKVYSLKTDKTKNILIVGSEEEFERVNKLVKLSNVHPDFIGWVGTNGEWNKHTAYSGDVKNLDESISVYGIDEVIFCAKDLPSQAIIDYMLKLVSMNIDFKIAPPESLSIIGSNSIDTAGDLYVIDTNSVQKPHNKRKKRILDIAVSIVALVFLPVFVIFQKRKLHFIVNIFSVLFGMKTWVGYGSIMQKELPKIKPSVLSPADKLADKQLSQDTIKKLNLVYSKDYKIENDLSLLFHCFGQLGN